jgi:hypothetical protein
MIDVQTPPGRVSAAGPEINCNALDKQQRIAASTDCHEPYCRSRLLRIREHDLPELIAHAELLERRS